MTLTFKASRCPWTGLLALVAFTTLVTGTNSAIHAEQSGAQKAADKNQKVSYDKEIRPIFQAQCLGCHQPSKAGGRYVMTSFDLMLKGGESGDQAIMPHRPEE